MSDINQKTRRKTRIVTAFVLVCLMAASVVPSLNAMAQTCSPCPGGTAMTLYVGSDPNQTYIAGTSTKATEVTNNYILQYWTSISSAPQCNAKWVWKNASGTPAFEGETAIFINSFSIPSGYTVSKACLEISADDEATIELNEKNIGSHGDDNNQPSGGPSGWDEVSAIDVPVALFHSGVNVLTVTVTDVHGINAGAIWCLKICLVEDSLGCPACSPAANNVSYVVSNPPETKIAASNTPATVVTNSYVLNAWADLPSNPSCQAAWVWKNSSGQATYHESIDFVNTFNLPPGDTVISACLEICADDKAFVFLNNQQITVHSGHNQASVLNYVNPNLFVTGSNTLRVTIKDVEGNYAGGIWCLKICVSRSARCQCGKPELFVKPDAGTPGIASPGQIFYADVGSQVTVLLQDACYPPECVSEIIWELRDQESQQLMIQDVFDCTSGFCEASFIMPDKAAKFFIPSYLCGLATCEGPSFLIYPCECGYWTHGVIESASGKTPIPPQCGALGCTVQLPAQEGEICVHTKYICTEECQGGGAYPPKVYLWKVKSTIGGQVIAEGDSPVECRFCFPTVDLDNNGVSDTLIVEIIPVCGGAECEMVTIYINFVVNTN